MPSTFLWWLASERSGRAADWQGLVEEFGRGLNGGVKLGQMKGKMEDINWA